MDGAGVEELEVGAGPGLEHGAARAGVEAIEDLPHGERGLAVEDEAVAAAGIVLRAAPRGERWPERGVVCFRGRNGAGSLRPGLCLSGARGWRAPG